MTTLMGEASSLVPVFSGMTTSILVVHIKPVLIVLEWVVQPPSEPVVCYREHYDRLIEGNILTSSDSFQAMSGIPQSHQAI